MWYNDRKSESSDSNEKIFFSQDNQVAFNTFYAYMVEESISKFWFQNTSTTHSFQVNFHFEHSSVVKQNIALDTCTSVWVQRLASERAMYWTN